LGTPAFGQEDAVKDWFNVPESLGGLALVVEGDVKNHEFYTTDAKGNPLDKRFWDLDAPVTLQYRMKPGLYWLELPDSPEAVIKFVAVNIKEKELAVLNFEAFEGTERLIGTSVTASGPVDVKLEKLVKDFYAKGNSKLIYPLVVSPDENTIKFNTDLVWPIKPPKP
jgi:hypothetical protein